MRFCVVGCSHRTAPLALRERLAFDGELMGSTLDSLARLPDVHECMLLSTCNRVEVYALSDDPERAAERIRALVAQVREIDPAELEGAFYCHSDEAALLHIFRVTASLDAMVVGEAQIMGQVKRACSQARERGTLGAVLGRCMDRAFAIAKRVRTETEIARHPASLSSVAVDLAARIFDDLSSAAVLVVGAGEMAELALTHLSGQGATRVRVLNRSEERARALAARFSGAAAPFETLAQQLEWADIVITSTGSPEPIIDKALLAPLMKRRRQRTLFIVDIAVPRDVHEDVRAVRNLYLFDLDDLEQVVAENLKARRREARSAEKLVAAEVREFDGWLKSRDVVPLIRQLREHFSAVAREEARRAARRLKLDQPDQLAAIERMAEAIAKRLLHQPTVQLRRTGGQLKDAHGELPPADLTDAARLLFGLPAAPGPDQEGQAPSTAAPAGIAQMELMETPSGAGLALVPATETAHPRSHKETP